MADCSQFVYGSRQRQICDGDSELSLRRVNAFRMMFGVDPLPEVEKVATEMVVSGQVVSRVVPKFRPTQSAGGCCGGGKTKPVRTKRMKDGTGVGGRLITMFKAHGFEACEACYALAHRMNEWGPDGCRMNLDEIVADILPRALSWEAEQIGWWAKLMPQTVTEMAIRAMVISAIETASPLEWQEESVSISLPSITESKPIRRRNTFTNETHSGHRNVPLVGVPIERGKIQSHILYHVMPLSGETEWVWRRHCEWLRSVRNNFTGRMIIGIVTPGKEDRWSYFPPEEVQRELAGLDAEFITAPNEVIKKVERQGRGEGVLFPMLLEKVMTENTDHVAFYGHCKGVTRRGTTPHSPPHLWADVMFETVFRNHDNAIKELDTHGITGSFLMRGKHPIGLPGLGPNWFYSGTFFAMRLADVSKRPWQRIPGHYGCVEQWPRLNFTMGSEASCLFFNGVHNLYDAKYWEDTIIPAFLDWKRKNNK